jgi:hypothetical protein
MSYTQDLINIANAIRNKKNISYPITLKEMGNILTKDCRFAEVTETDAIKKMIQDPTSRATCPQLIDEAGIVDVSTILGAKKLKRKAFYQCSNLKEIKLGETEIIGELSCSQCNNLTKVTAENVKIIETSAFVYSTSITDFIGSKVEIIKDSAFRLMSGRNTFLYFDFSSVKEVGNSAFFNNGLYEIDAPNLTKIEAAAFSGNSKLIQVKCPKLEIVSKKAFYGCSSLGSVSLYSAKVFETEAFSGCDVLKTLYLPNIERIGSNALPSSIEKIALPGDKVCVAEYSIPFTCTIYVNSSLIDIYKDNENWKQCTIKTMEDAEVENVNFIC